MRYFVLTIALFVIYNTSAFSQDIDKIFDKKSEIKFKFSISTKSEISKLTRIISIDNVKGNEVFAYANKKEFKEFLKCNYNYQIINNSDDNIDYNMLDNLNSKNIQAWDFYPTYNAYDSLMTKFQTNYPNLCRSFSIKTLASGRKLLFVKISDNPDINENEPKFLYTSSMHGDELTGYILMLRLIDYLLSNYGTNPRITEIVNNTEIWINPLANPDGAYKGGNSTVASATRFNGNNIDLNRNYPDPQYGQHPDGEAWQQETIAFMALADSIQFSMSANIHGGAEVCNYPFDTWAKLPADSSWWNFVCREYADTVHVNSVSGYLNDINNGVTNGYYWYQLIGGRQDYMNYFKHCREFTLEISNTKKPVSSTLPNYWNYNYRSLLNYIEQCKYGIRGIITDSITGNPLKAKVFIQGHDADSSHIYSQLPLGNYFRPIFSGTYSLTYSASGYFPKTVSVNIANKATVIKDIQLVPTIISINEDVNDLSLQIFPNPANRSVNVSFKNNTILNIQIIDISGNIVYQKAIQRSEEAIQINTSEFSKGMYNVVFQTINNVKSSRKLIID